MSPEKPLTIEQAAMEIGGGFCAEMQRHGFMTPGAESKRMIDAIANVIRRVTQSAPGEALAKEFYSLIEQASGSASDDELASREKQTDDLIEGVRTRHGNTSFAAPVSPRPSDKLAKAMMDVHESHTRSLSSGTGKITECACSVCETFAEFLDSVSAL